MLASGARWGANQGAPLSIRALGFPWWFHSSGFSRERCIHDHRIRGDIPSSRRRLVRRPGSDSAAAPSEGEIEILAAGRA